MEPTTEATIREEIATLRDAPFAVGETQLDRAAKTGALYQKLYPSSAPTAPRESSTADEADPAIASLTRDALRERITATVRR